MPLSFWFLFEVDAGEYVAQACNLEVTGCIGSDSHSIIVIPIRDFHQKPDIL